MTVYQQMTIFLNRGGKSPHFANVSASMAYYLSPQKRAEIQDVIVSAETTTLTEPDTDTLATLSELCTSETLTAWGTVADSDDYHNKFDQLQPNDWFLIRTGYHNRDDRYIRFAQQVDLTVGTDIAQHLRKSISNIIWGSPDFSLLWFSATPVWEFEAPEDRFEDLVRDAEPEWSFQDWFAGQGDNFKILPGEWTAAHGGDGGFVTALRGGDATQRGRNVAAYRLLRLDGADGIRWYEPPESGAGPQHLVEEGSGRGTPLKSLREVRNEAVVLLYDDEAVVGQGRLGYVGSDDRDDISGTSAAIVDYQPFPSPRRYGDLSAPVQTLIDEADGDIIELGADLVGGLGDLAQLMPQKQPDTDIVTTGGATGPDTTQATTATESPDDLLTDIKTAPPRAAVLRRQLEDAQQIIFHGPPGTGKTYTARQFARWWLGTQVSGTPTTAQLETVTFHPSFTYEDFVEGLTATETNGTAEYTVETGVFRDLCMRAREAYEATAEDSVAQPFVLIIDEINRGNLADIFGDTMTLLEADKRGEAGPTVTLPHSKEPFSVPPNVYLIGTMNTADRSIALVDAALRRRFRFIPFQPDRSVLHEAYDFADADAVEQAAASGTDPVRVLLALSIRALATLNRRIVDAPDLSKGQQIGHSYLLGMPDRPVADQLQWLVDIWQFEILPLLEEYLFGQFDRIQAELFQGAGDQLFDAQTESVRGFSAADLGQALADLTGNELTDAAVTGLEGAIAAGTETEDEVPTDTMADISAED